MLSITERSIRGRIGAYSLHALNDTHEVSLPGRVAAASLLEARLLAELDPENRLSTAERERRLEHAKKAHFQKLALRSAQKRRRGNGP